MTEVQNKKTTSTAAVKRFKWVEWVFVNLPFVCFLALLALVQIANAHFAEKSLRRIDKLKKEVNDKKAQYINLKQQLMYGSTQSQLAKKLESKQIKPLAQFPKKLTASNENGVDKK